MSSLSDSLLGKHNSYEGTAKWCPKMCKKMLQAVANFGDPQFQALLKANAKKVQEQGFLFSDGSLKIVSAGSHRVPTAWRNLSLESRLTHLWYTVNFKDYTAEKNMLATGRYQPLSLAELSWGHACKVISPGSNGGLELHLQEALEECKSLNIAAASAAEFREPPGDAEKKLNALNTLRQTRGLLLGSLLCLSLASANQVIADYRMHKKLPFLRSSRLNS